jgi:hypothetical protein
MKDTLWFILYCAADTIDSWRFAHETARSDWRRRNALKNMAVAVVTRDRMIDRRIPQMRAYADDWRVRVMESLSK